MILRINCCPSASLPAGETFWPVGAVVGGSIPWAESGKLPACAPLGTAPAPGAPVSGASLGSGGAVASAAGPAGGGGAGKRLSQRFPKHPRVVDYLRPRRPRRRPRRNSITGNIGCCAPPFYLEGSNATKAERKQDTKRTFCLTLAYGRAYLASAPKWPPINQKTTFTSSVIALLGLAETVRLAQKFYHSSGPPPPPPL